MIISPVRSISTVICKIGIQVDPRIVAGYFIYVIVFIKNPAIYPNPVEIIFNKTDR